MATIVGTSGNNTVIGDTGDDNIYGDYSFFSNIILMDSAKIVYKLFGNDTLSGGVGNDQVFGDTGSDSLNVSGNANLISYAFGVDTLYGGLGDDILSGDIRAASTTISGSNNIVSYKFGNDTLYGNEGTDVLTGDVQNLFTTVSGSSNQLTYNFGNDTLYGADGNDFASGDSQIMNISVSGADNQLTYNFGNDIVYAGSATSQTNIGFPAGANRVPGDAFRTFLNMNGDGNTLTLNAANEQFIGGTGSDNVVVSGIGQFFADATNAGGGITGSYNHISIFGGNSTANSYDGLDAIRGGEVVLYFTFAGSYNTFDYHSGHNYLNAGEGGPVAAGTPADFIEANLQDLNFGFTGNNNTANLVLGDDIVVQGSGQAQTRGDTFFTTITTSGNNNSINVDAGNDSFTTGAGADDITGDSAIVTFTIGGANNVVSESMGNDTIDSGTDADVIYDDAANIAVALNATSANNTVTLSFGTNIVNAGDGDDVIFSHAQTLDVTDLGLGNNVVLNLGADQLTGGAGADTFNFVVFDDNQGLGIDTVTDLTTQDILQFSGVNDTNSDSLLNLGDLQQAVNVYESGANVIIDFLGNDASITLGGVATGSISSLDDLVNAGYQVVAVA